MGNFIQIGGPQTGRLIIGAAKDLEFEVLTPPTHATPLIPVNITGMTFVFKVRRGVGDTDTVFEVSGADITIIGTWASTRAANTQRLRVHLSRAKTLLLTPQPHEFACGRTNTGVEDDIAYGPLIPEASASH